MARRSFRHEDNSELIHSIPSATDDGGVRDADFLSCPSGDVDLRSFVAGYRPAQNGNPRIRGTKLPNRVFHCEQKNGRNVAMQGGGHQVINEVDVKVEAVEC